MAQQNAKLVCSVQIEVIQTMKKGHNTVFWCLFTHSKLGVMPDSCEGSKIVTLLTTSDHFTGSFPVVCLLNGIKPTMTIMNSFGSCIVVLARVKYAWGM